MGFVCVPSKRPFYPVSFWSPMFILHVRVMDCECLFWENKLRMFLLPFFCLANKLKVEPRGSMNVFLFRCYCVSHFLLSSRSDFRFSFLFFARKGCNFWRKNAKETSKPFTRPPWEWSCISQTLYKVGTTNSGGKFPKKRRSELIVQFFFLYSGINLIFDTRMYKKFGAKGRLGKERKVIQGAP